MCLMMYSHYFPQECEMNLMMYLKLYHYNVFNDVFSFEDVNECKFVIFISFDHGMFMLI